MIRAFVRRPDLFSRLVVMVQREVADRLVSPPGGDAYGFLTLDVGAHASARKLFDVGSRGILAAAEGSLERRRARPARARRGRRGGAQGRLGRLHVAPQDARERAHAALWGRERARRCRRRGRSSSDRARRDSRTRRFPAPFPLAGRSGALKFVDVRVRRPGGAAGRRPGPDRVPAGLVDRPSRSGAAVSAGIRAAGDSLRRRPPRRDARPRSSSFSASASRGRSRASSLADADARRGAWKLAGLLLLAVALTGAVTLPLKKVAVENMGEFRLMGGALVAMAVLLFVGQRVGTTRGEGGRTLDEMRPRDAALVGACQSLSAIFHGFSRSGNTIVTGLFSGLSRRAAAEFSFLLSIPTILAAAAVENLHAYRHHTGPLWRTAPRFRPISSGWPCRQWSGTSPSDFS